MRVHSHRLENFDFSFNPTLDEAQVRELLTADFVTGGENLVIVGGPATAKTTIALAIIEAAQNRGLTSYQLNTSGCDDYDLIALPFGYIGGSGNGQSYERELLDCDVLVVDDFYTRMPSLLFISLLRRRTQLGKSNILITYPVYLEADLKRELVTNGNDGYKPSAIARDAGDDAWVELLNPNGFDVRPRFAANPQPRLIEARTLLAAIGLVDLDTLDPRDSGAARNAYATVPAVWHTLKTGDRSYRDFLRSQGLLA